MLFALISFLIVQIFSEKVQNVANILKILWKKSSDHIYDLGIKNSIFIFICLYAIMLLYRVPGTTRTESTVYKCCFTSADIKKLTECETAFIMLDVVSVYVSVCV